MIRKLIVRSDWEWHDKTAIGFLAEVLWDGDSRVWKQALDGLVAFASPGALAILYEARSVVLSGRSETLEFRQYLDEAIEQVLAGGF